MIRVVWHVPLSKEWIGGLNYFVNLAEAVMAEDDRRIEICLLDMPPSPDAAPLPEPLAGFERIPVVNASAARFSRAWFKHILKHWVLNLDSAQVEVFKQHDIRLFSHGWPLSRRGSSVPEMVWIPDFQHKHLPHMFTRDEILFRDLNHARVARCSKAVLVSSETARADFTRFFPKFADKAYVLRFVSSVKPAALLPPTAEVLAAYGISEPYFHIPNQLWKHKNHGVVVDAMKILSERGIHPLVISTGLTRDRRSPEYFPELEARVKAYGLQSRFRFLDLIPFEHVSVLMRNSMAMINPSRFEGWSTTVEEAKTLGKRLLLSSIAVHREQAPERGLYFDPDSPVELADHIQKVLETLDTDEENRWMKKAEQDFPARRRAFAKEYEDIVLKVIGEK